MGQAFHHADNDVAKYAEQLQAHGFRTQTQPAVDQGVKFRGCFKVAKWSESLVCSKQLPERFDRQFLFLDACHPLGDCLTSFLSPDSAFLAAEVMPNLHRVTRLECAKFRYLNFASQSVEDVANQFPLADCGF